MSPRGNLADRIWESLSANLGAKLVSIGLAVVLWAVVLGSRSVEVTKEVPLEIVTSPDIVAANDVPDRLAFRLAGPKAFLRAILDRREDPIRVNLTGAKPGVITYRFFSDNIRVPIGVKVLAINPAAIPIRLEPVRRKEVPVRVELRGVSPDGYHISSSRVEPKTVRIKGAESRVEAVSEISTIPIDVSGIRSTSEREATLDLTRLGVQLDSPVPRVFIDVEAASANYRIKNVDIRVLSPYKVKTDEKTVTVLVRAEPKDLKLLDRTHVYAVVDLTGKPKGDYTEAIRVTVPDGVGLVKVIPERVKVTLY